MSAISHDELVKSNWGFISPGAQAAIRDGRILSAGCGLGSSIALLAARTGFARFILADGDSVECSNLNRQAFRCEHLGINKAEATGTLVKEINPDASVRVLPGYTSKGADVDELASEADMVVNIVDPGDILYSLNQTACSHGNPVLFPLNIGFGGAVFVLTQESATLEDVMPRAYSAAPDSFIKLILKMETMLPAYLKEHSGIIDTLATEKRSLPQLGTAVSITTALVVTGMVELVLGVPVDVAPKALTSDVW